jgi:superfamily II DNA or RNA helicase
VGRLRFEETEPLSRICVRLTDPAWFGGLSTRLQVLALAPLLREAALGLVALPEAYALMEQALTPVAASHPQAALALAEQALLRGRLDQADVLLAGLEDPEALALRGWSSVLKGDYQGGIERCEAALELTRKLTRKRNLALPGIPGTFYLLALLRRGGPDDLERVGTQIAIAKRLGVPGPIGTLYDGLGDLAAILAGRRRVEEVIWSRFYLSGRGPWPILFQALALHWLGTPLPTGLPQALAGCIPNATAAGFLWYAQEARALLDAIGPPVESATPMVPIPGIVPITDLLSPRPPWELALEALKVLGTQGPGGEPVPEATAGPDRRLAWQLTVRDGCGSLEPREQKRNQRGVWSMGRPVALKRLAEGPEAFPYLTPQDREICACIVREQETSWYNGQERTVYFLAPDRALLAACGHPLLTCPAVPTQVELVRGGPTLAAVRRSKDILVSIEPYPPGDRSLLALEENPQRVRLIQFEPRHREIARILGPKGLSVPLGAQGRLLEGLTAVAPLLPVHSDIAGVVAGAAAGAEAVPADPRPHLHLTPLGDGLTLDLHVHPLGEAGPHLRPGQGHASLFTEQAGRVIHCTRDLDSERAAARGVPAECPILDGNDGWTWELDDPELALGALEQLQALGAAVVLDWPQGKRIALTAPLQLGQLGVAIRTRGDWLELAGEVRLADGRVLAMRELLDLAAASKGRFVRLADNAFLALSEALRRRLEALRGLTDGGRFHPLAAPAIAEVIDGMAVAAAPAWEALLARIASLRDLEPQTPSTLQAELRDYQAEGYRWLARLAHWGAGACLADDMGLGKTVQALALILSRAPQGPTLVLAPMSVCGNWMDEARRFAPTLRPQRFGPGHRAAALKNAGPFDLIVCSYGLLQTEAERLAEVQWETVCADEAQAFKNALTKRSQAVMRLAGGFRMITTGTPVENRLGELWNLFRFINPGLLGSLESFNRRFAIPIEQDQDSGARQRLRQLLRPFILRRLKSEVLSELPPRTEITLRLELGEGEMALYEALRERAMERLDQAAEVGVGQRRMQLLAEIMRLRRACCHPRLTLPDSDLPSAKLEAFGEIVSELLDNRHKALVFSQFVDHLRLIRAHLDGRGIRYQYLDGSTPEPQRRAAVAAFQAGEGDLFLISLRAGGTGLNLTAADYVIHMDPWWNPAVEDQASDRAHRLGQERPVTVYRLVAKDTIEERILKLHAGKRELADGLLAGSEDGGRLSYEDMLALVRGADLAG